MPKLPLLVCAAVLIANAAPYSVQAADISPAIVYSMGGKFDKSFNEGVLDGARAFTKQTGIKVRDFEPQQETQQEQALRNFARRGDSPIIAVGFSQATPLKSVAPAYPKQKFAIIDAEVDAPNVQSILFREEEGSYLAGMLAAMKSQTGTIGFVGGMDVPLIRKFACGYKQGAEAANPKITVIENMTGSTPAAWNNPVRGAELARSQIDRGADVIFQAAGATGMGVLQATADAGKYGIGVDSNQNALHPGHVLTSMVKRVDVATEKTLNDAQDGTWKPGTEVLGLNDNGVGLAFDENNAKIVTPGMRERIAEAKADIIAGKTKVHDYMTDNACPN